MLESKSASPPVVPVEAPSALRCLPLLNCNSFLLTDKSFCKNFACNLIQILYVFTILLVVRVI
jgi:hypothetical protein